MERQSNLAKQKAEDATTQAQEGLREAETSKQLAQAAYALVMHEQKEEKACASGAPPPEAAASLAAGVDAEFTEMPEHSETPPKIQRGRGRPRKNLDQHQREEPAYSKKRGRGRLQKHLIADADSEEKEEEAEEDAGRERCGMKSGRKEGEEEECKDKKILKYKDLKAIFENKERLGGGAGGAGGEGGSGTVRLWLNGKWNSHEVCMHMCVLVCLCACI